MKCCSQKNLTRLESSVRLGIATLLIVVAVAKQDYIIMLLAVIPLITGYKHYCPLYDLFGINQEAQKRNRYAAILPKYRNSPVMVFGKKGELLYTNEHGEKMGIAHAVELGIDDVSSLIKEQRQAEQYYQTDQQHYKLDYVGAQEDGVLLVYFNDVTQMVQLAEEIKHTQREIIYTMGEIGELRSKETGSHVKRVAKYSKLLAQLAGLGKEDANLIYMASPMHDIGKVAIPDAILHKPGKLTNEEFEVMKTHAQLGYEMLKHSNQPIIKAAATVAHEHHEKFDGSGYPRGLSGEQIHIFGRITAIADVFDALGSDRVYKTAWELERILELFKQERGKHFDPRLVDLFLTHLDQFLEIRDTYTD